MSQEITVYAKAKVNFQYPSGCLPTSGLVQFANNSTVSDGQTLSYTWDFGDPYATTSNPNTAALANPTHNYTKDSSY
ncbi:PKD domain-containing protein, partial [Salmonella sp. SAL4447]|uniref:PKD domain-containing protein n=1 Tax=Salmonella sp. SAL4447 TaxID=3159902 RepID=UPI0039793D57